MGLTKRRIFFLAELWLNSKTAQNNQIIKLKFWRICGSFAKVALDLHFVRVKLFIINPLNN